MDESGINGRTHEPALREVVANLDGIEKLLLSRITAVEKQADERDRWYSERDRDRQAQVDRALAAAEKQTTASFTASEKAIVKAEAAQSEYNVRSNEFRGQLDDQAKRLIPRLEVEGLLKNIEEKVTRVDTDVRMLRESRSTTAGRSAGAGAMWGYVAAGFGFLLTLLSLLSTGATVLYMLMRSAP